MYLVFVFFAECKRGKFTALMHNEQTSIPLFSTISGFRYAHVNLIPW